jgi:hypothetical protein
MKVRNLPDPDRLSVLTAMIVLAYTVTKFVVLPVRELALQLPGLYISAELSINTIIALLVAGLTTTGADWLIRDHPLLQSKQAWRNALLPALSAWVIGIPLSQLSFGLTWWLVLAIGVALVILTIIAEYIVIDIEDVRYPLAAAWLTAVSFVLYLVLVITLRTTGVRLLFLLPACVFAGWLAAIRTLHLRLHGEWAMLDSLVIGLLLGQWLTALHYWPLSALTFGLAALGALYALTSFAGGLAEGHTIRQALVEPVIGLFLAFLAGYWFR